jgi:glycosyltransferase involved in cell wall biosynthesis
MRIALVAPEPIGGERGGAENLYDGLVMALNRAGHNASKLSIPVDETAFEGILEAYCRFFYLDLSDYDLVISTKAPTYMVRHKNHISYLLHTIRVFYDMFEREVGSRDMRSQRQLIHRFDRYGLDTSRVRAHFVNGSAVCKRMIAADDFWKGIDFRVLHHPPSYDLKEPKRGEFVFFPGRLHRWKRPELVIQAMDYVEHNVELLITGRGEDEVYYRQLSKDDERIKFLGQIGDEVMADLYSRAIVVPFVPINEDYGLITVEAFMGKKPVITCTDSGEPADIVRDSVSGFIVDPDPRKIAEKINYLVENPGIADAMGLEGFRSVQNITWENTVKSLLERDPAPGRRRILVTDNQVLDPPIGGGRVRIYQLYRNFNPSTSAITYIGTFDWLGNGEREQKLADHFVENLVPMTSVQLSIDRIISRLCGNMTTLDVTAPLLMRFTPRYQRRLHRHISDCDVIIVAHPWVYPYVKRELNGGGVKKIPALVYDSHNVEYLIKRKLLNGTILGRILAKRVKNVEGDLARDCDLIFACSDDDARSFSEIYGVKKDRILVIPNGAAIEEMQPPASEEKEAMRKHYGFGSRFVAVFLASGGYRPNDVAAQFICQELAPQLTEIEFLLVGSVCETVKYKNKIPENVRAMGVVSREDKIGLLHASDLAINPVAEGSGTNIKIFDYLAAGLPVVTTPVGARGIDLRDLEDAIIADLNEFPDAIRMVVNDEDLSRRLSLRSRALAERYDWRKIAEIAEKGVLGLVAR